jgi:TolB-like protein/Flp pilus assembly protein TadD
MKSSGPASRLRHLFTAVREYLTHWALAGAILALTGFAPEHWFADFFQHFAIADRLRNTWLAGADIRIGFVAVGVAIVAWDVLRRSMFQKQKTPLDIREETLEVVRTPAQSSDDQKQFQATKVGTPPLPDKPSIAVLPFENMSGDSEQAYFADGMVEEIITALSRMRWLFVIARNSSFTYKGRAVEVKQVGRELGVRYVLEGSVRKASGRVRITAQLVDASTGTHLWADRFDGGLEDVFDLQDQVTTSVVGAIAPKLEHAEIERAKHKPTESLDAYDYYLRGLARVYLWTREGSDEARRLFYKAIELDPDFASAYGMVGYGYVQRKANGWMTDRTREIAEAVVVARRAAELGEDDANALSRAGQTLAFVAGELDAGAALIDRALALNPNLATGWFNSGFVRVWLGEPELAIEHLTRAMRLSPLDTLFFAMQTATAFAHFFAGRNSEALSWAEKALQRNPNFNGTKGIAAACYAFAGRQQEAQKAAAHLLQTDPSFRVSNLTDYYPLRRQQDVARYAEGLRKAGLPE